MTISRELGKLIYEKLAEGMHKEDSTKTYNVRLVLRLKRYMTLKNKILKEVLKVRRSCYGLLKKSRRQRNAPCTEIINKIDTVVENYY